MDEAMQTLRADHGTDRRTRSFYQAARADDTGGGQGGPRSRSFYQGRGLPDSLRRERRAGAYDDGHGGGRGKSRSFYERLADANEIATAPGKVSLVAAPGPAPTRPPSPCDPGGNVDDKRTLSTLGLLLIAFFWVGGGIYGNEPLLESGPPAFALSLLIGAALFYALPLAMISAELGTALPYDGGMVAWVNETCGRGVGLHNMYWLWVSFLFDSAAYPVLAASYASQKWDAEYFTGDKTEGETFIATMIIAFITGMKLAGSDFVVKLSGLFFVVSLLPSTYFMIYGSTVKLEPAGWVVTDTSDDVGGYKPATLFSWITWLYCGFNSLGSLAGEVKDPGRTYPIVVLTLIPAVIMLYVWPIAVAVSLDPNRTRYVPGHFTAVAVELSGEWLGNCFLAGAAVCFIGNYNADIIVCERSIAAFAEPYTVAYLNHKRRGVVTRYLLTENGTGVAPVYIVMNAALAAVLVWLPYNTLIEFSMLLMFLNMVLFVYAYLYYKWTRPLMKRPYCVPGGKVGAVCVVVPVIGITGLTGYFSIVDDEVLFGVPYAKAWGLAAFVGFGILVHAGAIAVAQAVLACSKPRLDLNSEAEPLLRNAGGVVARAEVTARIEG